jgi:hypothetical protein
MEETILTRHPQGKRGVRISRAKYDMVRAAIVAALSSHGSLTFMELAGAVEKQLRGAFDGSVMWYVTVVKLDMEARRELFRVEKSKPQKISLS